MSVHAASVLCNTLQADLLGVEDPASSAASAPAEPNLASVDDLGDFFNAPAQPAAPTATGAAANNMDMFAARPEPQANGHAAAQQQRQQQPPPRPPRAAGREPGKGPVLDDRVRRASLCCGSSALLLAVGPTTSSAGVHNPLKTPVLCYRVGAGRYLGNTILQYCVAAAGGG